MSRFVRRTRPASRTSSASWTRSATPTPRCAISLRPSSSAAKNVSAVPYDMPRTQATRNPEATGLISWCCADRFARKANLDVLPSPSPRLQSTLGSRHPPNLKNKTRAYGPKPPAYERRRRPRPGAAAVCSCLGAVAQVHHAVAEPALVHQFELKPDPVGEEVLTARWGSGIPRTARDPS